MKALRERDIKGSPAYERRIRMIKEWGKRNPARLKMYQARHRTKTRLHVLVRSAVNRCKKSGMPYDLEFLKTLIPTKPVSCPCCSKDFDYTLDTIIRHVPKWRSPSLDRVDPKQGYVRGNVHIICWRCNALKRDATLSEVEAIVAYMRNHHDSK